MMNEELKNKAFHLAALCRKQLASGKKIAITGHDSPDADSIISAVMMKRLLRKLDIECSIKFGTLPDNVTLRDMRELGVMGEISFDGFAENDTLLLVDHHSSFYSQEAFACVDHHTTPPEPKGELCVVVAASSCGRVVFDMARADGLEDEMLEKLAIYSVYLDTQSCQSPKYMQGDTEWLEKGIEKYGINRDKITKMGYCLNDASEDIEILAMYGYKRYCFNGKESFSTCIQIDSSEPMWDELTKSIVAFLADKLEKENGILWAFVLNKPMMACSDIYYIERGGHVEKAELDRLASRSRDVIPYVRRASGDI